MNYVYHQLFCISRFGLLVDCFKMIIFWFKGMELDEYTSDDILKTVLNKRKLNENICWMITIKRLV